MRLGRRPDLPDERLAAWWSFLDAAEVIEGGRRILLGTLPTLRVAPTPIALGTAAMRRAIIDARTWMDAWRVDELAPEWDACAVALGEADGALAEVERLAATSDEMDHVLGALQGVIDPLDAFADAERAFRRRWRCPERPDDAHVPERAP